MGCFPVEYTHVNGHYFQDIVSWKMWKKCCIGVAPLTDYCDFKSKMSCQSGDMSSLRSRPDMKSLHCSCGWLQQLSLFELRRRVGRLARQWFRSPLCRRCFFALCLICCVLFCVCCAWTINIRFAHNSIEASRGCAALRRQLSSGLANQYCQLERELLHCFHAVATTASVAPPSALASLSSSKLQYCCCFVVLLLLEPFI